MLNHKGTQTIETSRLILRQFKYEDATDMFNNWANDSEVTKYLMWKPHGNVEVTKDILKHWIIAYNNLDNYNWTIELKDIGKAIGGISVIRYDEISRSCEVGYCMAKRFWGEGIMSEALKAVIDYLLSQVGFNRIWAIHDTNNPNSGKVMLKSGMNYEGTQRQAKIRSNEEFYDVAMYAILRDDLAERGETK